MKKNKFNIYCAWILLFCFAAGQYMVGVHQHNALIKSQVTYNKLNTTSKNQPAPNHTVQEKCYFCDAMHHNAMTINQQTYFVPVVVCGHLYKVGDYNFISIALVLAAGRAPPAPSSSC